MKSFPDPCFRNVVFDNGTQGRPAKEAGTAADVAPGESGRVMIRRTHLRKVEGRLARLADDIEQLRNRIAAPAGDIRDRFDLEIRDLGSKAEAVRDRVRAVEAAGASSWDA